MPPSLDWTTGELGTLLLELVIADQLPLRRLEWRGAHPHLGSRIRGLELLEASTPPGSKLEVSYLRVPDRPVLSVVYSKQLYWTPSLQQESYH